MALTRPDSSTVLNQGFRKWSTWEIPEYQDVQRLVNAPPKGDQYGPIACIVARPNLDLVNQSEYDSETGALVALVWVAPSSGTPNQSYKRLNLDKSGVNFYCVVIRHNRGARSVYDRFFGDFLETQNLPGITTGPNDGDWEAFVVPLDGGTCAIRSFDSAIKGVRYAVADPSMIPAVARFSTDKNWRAGIGVRCGSAWCSIGFGETMVAPPPHRDVTGLSAPAKIRHGIPGWYDDQEISLASGIPPGIEPKIKASVVPHPDLGTYTRDQLQGDFLPVASVYFSSAAPGKYSSKWHFTNSGRTPNTIELKRYDLGNDQYRYDVRINGRVYSNLTVLETQHNGVHIVGTARWAWSETDERIWVRCDDGCCLIDAS